MLTVSVDMHVWYHKGSQQHRPECVCLRNVSGPGIDNTIHPYIPTSQHRSSRVSGLARLPKLMACQLASN
jgi:hypothetical protein